MTHRTLPMRTGDLCAEGGSYFPERRHVEYIRRVCTMLTHVMYDTPAHLITFSLLTPFLDVFLSLSTLPTYCFSFRLTLRLDEPAIFLFLFRSLSDLLFMDIFLKALFPDISLSIQIFLLLHSIQQSGRFSVLCFCGQTFRRNPCRIFINLPEVLPKKSFCLAWIFC